MLPLAVLALFLGGACILGEALLITRRNRLGMERRIVGLRHEIPGNQPEETSAAETNKIVAQVGRFLLLRTDYPWPARTSLMKLILSAVISFLIIGYVTGIFFGAALIFAVPAALLASLVTARIVLIRERARTERTFIDSFPDAIDSMTRMLRAGLPIASAMQAIGQEDHSPIHDLFAAIANQMRIGIPIEDALRSSSKQIRLQDFRFFAVAVLLQQSAGGNLVSTLEVLSEIMRRRRAVRSKAKAVTAEIRFSAYVLGALPFLTTGALLVISPDYLHPLFTDSRGHVILGIAVGGLILSILTMRQMMKSITVA